MIQKWIIKEIMQYSFWWYEILVNCPLHWYEINTYLSRYTFRVITLFKDYICLNLSVHVSTNQLLCKHQIFEQHAKEALGPIMYKIDPSWIQC
jgi:hypothetical protein